MTPFLLLAGVKALQSIGLRTIEVEDFGDPCAAAEGSFLSSFVYNEFKSKKDSPVDISSWQTESDQWKRGRTLAESQNFARYLMESPSNILTPQRFVDVVSTKLKDASVSSKLTMNPRNKEWIAKKKMNAFLAVAKGSAEDPWLFEASYHGSSREQTDVVLVGKGMTNLVAVCKKNILYIAMSSSVLVNNLMKYVKS
jgi:aminopeptidase